MPFLQKHAAATADVSIIMAAMEPTRGMLSAAAEMSEVSVEMSDGMADAVGTASRTEVFNLIELILMAN